MDLATLVLVALASAFAAYRLMQLKLAPVLPALSVYLWLQFAGNLLALGLTPFSSKTTEYQSIYVVFEPVNWFVEIFVVREIYRLAFREYPGIASLTRWNAYLASALAVLLCLLLAASSPLKDLQSGAVLGFITFWDRCVMFVIALFIALMIVLLSRFPIKLESFLVANIIIFTALFFANAILLASSANETPLLVNVRYYGSAVIYTAAFFAWGIFLKSPAESHVVRTRKNIDIFEQQRLIAQINALNNVLVKAVRQ